MSIRKMYLMYFSPYALNVFKATQAFRYLCEYGCYEMNGTMSNGVKNLLLVTAAHGDVANLPGVTARSINLLAGRKVPPGAVTSHHVKIRGIIPWSH